MGYAGLESESDGGEAGGAGGCVIRLLDRGGLVRCESRGEKGFGQCDVVPEIIYNAIKEVSFSVFPVSKRDGGGEGCLEKTCIA